MIQCFMPCTNRNTKDCCFDCKEVCSERCTKSCKERDEELQVEKILNLVNTIKAAVEKIDMPLSSKIVLEYLLNSTEKTIKGENDDIY